MTGFFNFRPDEDDNDVAPGFRPDAEVFGATENVNSGEAEDERLWSLLSAYADGETMPNEAAEVERMLATDPAYARDLAFLRLTASSVPRLVEVEPPVALRDAIFAKTSHRPTLKKRVAAGLAVCRENFALPSSRYAFGGIMAAAGIAAFLFWPRHHARTIPQIFVKVNEPAGVLSGKPQPSPHIVTPISNGPVDPTKTVATNANSKAKPDAKTSANTAAKVPGGAITPDSLNLDSLVFNEASWKAIHSAANAASVKSSAGKVITKTTPATKKKSNQVFVPTYVNTGQKRRTAPFVDTLPYTVEPNMDRRNTPNLPMNPDENGTHDVAEASTPETASERVAVIAPGYTETPRVYNDSKSGRLVAAALSSLPADERFSRSNKELFAPLNANKEGLADDVRRSNDRGSAQIALTRLRF